MASTPRRTPGSQTPAGRQAARGPGGTGRRTAGTSKATGKAATGKPSAAKGGKTGKVPKAGKGAVPTQRFRSEPASAAPRGRSTRRPTARRTTTSSSSARRFQRRSGGRFTGRAAILALIISVLVLTLAYPLREYLAQRNQITAGERAEQAQRARIAALEKRKRMWEDPAYIKVQARKRLLLVEPGVIVYGIEYGRSAGAASTPGLPRLSTPRTSNDAPWYSQLWGSVRAADQPADVLPVDAPVLRGTTDPGTGPTPAPKPSTK